MILLILILALCGPPPIPYPSFESETPNKPSVEALIGKADKVLLDKSPKMDDLSAMNILNATMGAPMGEIYSRKFLKLRKENQQLKGENDLLAYRIALEPPAGQEKPIGVKTLAKALGKSERTVRRWEEEGLITSRRFKTHKKASLMFFLSEVKADLDKYRRKAI